MASREEKAEAGPPPSGEPGRPRRLRHETRIFLLALAGGLPAVVVAGALLWAGPYATRTRWTLLLLVAGAALAAALAIRGRVATPLRTLANVLAALREGDYSIRARDARRDEALGQLMNEANLLGETLYRQRLGAVEATHLLEKVMEEIDVAVFAFGEDGRLRLANRAAERLLARPAARLVGREAAELGLGDCLEGEPARTFERAFPGGGGRWGLRRSDFREEGRRHHLLVLTDLSRALREEERQAWRRIIRVLGHELNNSLAPIKSMAATVARLVEREPKPADWREDVARGLSVIEERAEALSRFMSAYARLARLPAPRLGPVDVGAWVRRVAAVETRMAVAVDPGDDLVIQADADQLEQALINLVRNAVDAAAPLGGGVRVGWRRRGERLEVLVEDEGPGLPESANLFVPFFTTKAGGTGIGLVLSRQIAEAHGGELRLSNRADGRGCTALLSLPVGAPPGAVSAPLD